MTLKTGKMATTHAMANPILDRTLKSTLRDYVTLTKPEVNLLILMTTSAGFYLASPGPMHIAGLINTLVGTLLVASGTATLNQWMERRWDGQMRRTANRPLPSGRLSTAEAFWFGMIVSVAGGLYLALTVNALSSLLAIFTLLSYLLVYTPLKRKTPLCTALGAIPGAMPTLIGWAGASAGINRGAWFLFAILFLWQFPHFLAIALMYRDDYARAGYRMLPSFDQDSRFTRAEILGFTIILIATTMLPVIDRTGPVYLITMLLSGAYMLYYVAKLMTQTTRLSASRLLHASVLYLPVVLAMLIAYKR
jgi:protoheme IX farnesyltransferase